MLASSVPTVSATDAASASVAPCTGCSEDGNDTTTLRTVTDASDSVSVSPLPTPASPSVCESLESASPPKPSD
eukprot:2170129-Prymnesium_polylepis.1